MFISGRKFVSKILSGMSAGMFYFQIGEMYLRMGHCKSQRSEVKNQNPLWL